MVEGGSEGVNVAAEVFDPAFEGLGRDVEWGGPDLFGLGASVLGDEGETEVDEAGVAFAIDENIARLDVAVDHSGIFSGLETGGDLGGDFEDFVFGKSATLLHDVLEATAFEQFHDEVKSPVGAADGVDFDDVWVADLGGEAGLIFEGLDADFVVTVFLVENLDGDFSVEGGVSSNEDDAHAADGVALFELVGSEGALYVCFNGAKRADCGLEWAEAGDVEEFAAPFAGFVNGAFSGGITHLKKISESA